MQNLALWRSVKKNKQKKKKKKEACLGVLSGDRVENKQRGPVVSWIAHLSLISLPKAHLKHSHRLWIRARQSRWLFYQLEFADIFDCVSDWLEIRVQLTHKTDCTHEAGSVFYSGSPSGFKAAARCQRMAVWQFVLTGTNFSPILNDKMWRLEGLHPRNVKLKVWILLTSLFVT